MCCQCIATPDNSVIMSLCSSVIEQCIMFPVGNVMSSVSSLFSSQPLRLCARGLYLHRQVYSVTTLVCTPVVASAYNLLSISVKIITETMSADAEPV